MRTQEQMRKDFGDFDKEFDRAKKWGKIASSIWLGVFLFVIVCWVSNLVTLIDLDFEAPYKAEIVHGAGLIPFVSCVTAFVNIEDGKEAVSK